MNLNVLSFSFSSSSSSSCPPPLLQATSTLKLFITRRKGRYHQPTINNAKKSHTPSPTLPGTPSPPRPPLSSSLPQSESPATDPIHFASAAASSAAAAASAPSGSQGNLSPMGSAAIAARPSVVINCQWGEGGRGWGGVDCNIMSGFVCAWYVYVICVRRAGVTLCSAMMM